MKNYNENERKNLVETYLDKHGASYEPHQISKVRDNFGSSYGEYLTQIYYALDMLSEEENPYTKFTELIESTFGIDINILEVGGGIYPALSEAIARRQKSIGKGSITVIDPLLSRNLENKSINYQRREFDRYDDIRKYDLIVGKEPCAATFEMIYKSDQYKKDIILSPCKCYGLLPSYMEFDDEPLKQWYDFVYTVMNSSNSTIETHYLDKSTHYDNPIYIKKFKKQ